MIAIPAKIELAAAADDKPATITILAYGGGVMRPGGWGDIVIDLAGLELSASVVLLADHANQLGSIVGSGRPEVRGGELHIVGQLARGTAAADHVIALHKSGVQLGASVGVQPKNPNSAQSGRIDCREWPDDHRGSGRSDGHENGCSEGSFYRSAGG